ncbi:MAG: permease-like cell division protein FtsX [Clostridia bacterium]|nr:permease-like cell division protein FtsX [Clostridia bacterium]
MKLRTWKYYINQGLRGIFKNGLMSFASIVIVSACIFIVILSLCIITNVDYILTQIESDIGVTLFLGEKPNEEDVNALISQIENMPEVSSVTFKSSDDALEDAKRMYSTDLLDGLREDNPLPRSLEIKLKDIKYQKSFIQKAEQLQWDFEEQILGISQADTPDTDNAQEQPNAQPQTNAGTQQTTRNNAGLFTDIAYAEPASAAPATQAVINSSAKDSQAADPANQAKTAEPTPEVISQPETAADTGEAALGDADYQFQGIELISHAQQLTDTLITMDTAFKLVSVVLVAILSIVSIGIIMNTIKLTVFIRKNEINIMKYVGATDWFIRWPFIIEGVIIGLIGAIIPSVLCTLGYIKLYNFFNSEYTILKVVGQLKPAMDIFTVIIPVALIVGMLIGAIGSISSIRKHLNV